MDKLYRIEELSTTGWSLIDPHQTKLTKEKCSEELEKYIAAGYNPNAMRAVPDEN